MWYGARKDASDGKWYWQGESQQEMYVGIWATNEPNLDGDCLHSWNKANDYKMADNPCHFEHPFFCEKPISNNE